jgi:hypothetical protein
VVVPVIRATRPSSPSKIAAPTIAIAAFSKEPLKVAAMEYNPMNRHPEVSRFGST